ncbi:MAG: two-component system, OmpR family, phosphate regulon sensor histidine kinase PhoR [Sphingomonadales bacterium]|jgi:two-component system phosphate regulon sensor histidine kinase PhoR|nr:two-component system, OmpR family, phosphate regulon sensor histidine kinase PhoR [Sphingomonadales bacterium]
MSKDFEEASTRPFAFVDALPEPSLVVRGGVVVAGNAAARAVLGDSCEGEDIRLVIRQPAALERLLRSGPADEEIELFGLGGFERRWMMSVAAVDDDAKLVRLTDRSEAHAAEQMRVDFVANASHELRTPLATLVGYAETLREQGDDLDAATRSRFTGIVHDEARRMQRLVEDLISLSRIEAERFTAPTDALDLQPLVEEAVSLCQTSASERGCDLKISVADGLPRVAGDRAQLLQVLDNLISNGIRYGRTGGPITIAAAAEGETIHLRVSDVGEGVAPEHIPRLTERFYRVDASRSRTQGGTGLGLSIVKHIVERHRGRLSIESRLGAGTTVHVHLPKAEKASS